MNMAEKLQKAVELTISAGFQLDRDAFEFLNLAASTVDPVEIVSRTLEKIGKMKDKPLFIERHLLEETVETHHRNQETFTMSEIKQQQEFLILEGKKIFRPYAKEIEAEINIIEDPGSKSCTDGTIEDYLEYFRDRFRKMEKLLRQRIDVRDAVSILDVLKAAPSTKHKIICMVTEKREAKQRILLTVEDLQVSATVLIPQNAPHELLTKASKILPDQVICITVLKTRGNLLIAEDIIFPDVAKKTQNRAAIPVYAALTSDMHVGSTMFQKEAFNRFILWLNGKYGNEKMREIAGHVKYVLIAGDIIDGIGVYPNQIKELSIRDVYAQYRLAAKLIEQIPDYIEVIIIPGNHDTPRKALPQPPLSGEYLERLQESRKVYSLGNPSLFSLHKVEVLMYHGRSLDDVISTVPGMEYDHPEKAMSLLLQYRHLAPVYGAKTPISPERRDFLVLERLPDIFHSGHIHTLGHTNYRGILIINSGCWQAQTDYMRRLGITPMPNLVPIVNLQTFDVEVLSFN